MNSFPFDSVITGYDPNGMPLYDRASNSTELARLLQSFFCDGVFGKGMCTVTAGTGMTAAVGAGACLIRGRYGYIAAFDTVRFDAANASPRIDTVVLRLDLSADARAITPSVHKGAAGPSPVAPALTRDDTVWELGLANVLIPANVTAVSQGNITDTRLNTARCGLVAAVQTTIDTTTLYKQIQADLAGFRSTEKASFEAWFKSIQNMLDGDVAANLALKVSKKAEAVKSTATLSAGGWSAGEPYVQQVSVPGVTAANEVVVSPAPSCHAKWCESGVYASAQAADRLTFTAKSLPGVILTANVLCINNAGGAV